MFKKLKNNNKGAVLLYVVMVIGVVMVMFSAMFSSLNNTSSMTLNRYDKQQLQLNAQSTLSVLINEFKNSDENTELLRTYAETAKNTGSPVSATFTYDGDSNMVFTAYVDYYSDKYAKITIEALDTATNNVAKSFDIIKFGDADRNSVFDNMFVVYHPDLDNGVLNSDRMKSKVFNGNMVIDHKSTDALTYSYIDEIKDNLTNVPTTTLPAYEGEDLTIVSNSSSSPTQVSSVVSNGIIRLSGDGNSGNILQGLNNAMIASPVGRVYIDDLTLAGSFSLVAAAGQDANDASSPAAGGGIEMTNVKVDTDDDDLMVLTRDSGYINLSTVTGTVGNIRSGGALTISDSTNLTVGEDVVVYKATTMSAGTLNIGGSLFGNSSITTSGGSMTVGGDLFSAGKITIASTLKANGVYGGNSVTLGSSTTLYGNSGIPTVLAGANYKNSSRGDLKNNSSHVAGSLVYNYTGTGSSSSSGTLYKLSSASSDYWDAFAKANNYWRDGIAYCTKGGFGTGIDSPSVNLVVALTKSSDTAKLTSNSNYIFDGTTSIATGIAAATNKVKTIRQAANDKYVTIDGNNWYIKAKEQGHNFNVSGDLTFANDDSKLLIRTEICDWIGGPSNSYNLTSFSEGAIMTLYNDAISKYGIPPIVVDRVSQPLSATYATIQEISETEYAVISGGRMELAGDYSGTKTIRANYVGEGIVSKEISDDAKLTFDNTSASYTIYLTKIDGSTAEWLYFPWDIEVKYTPVPYATARTDDYTDSDGITWKAAGDENSVAFILGADDKIWFYGGEVSSPAGNDITAKLEYVQKKNSDGTCEYAIREYTTMPEVYFLSPRESESQELNQNTDPAFRFDNDYYFKGFIVAPRTYVSFERVSRSAGEEVFKGIIMAKDIVFDPGNTSTVYSHYFPLSYNNVLNEDNFVMYLDQNGSQ